MCPLQEAEEEVLEFVQRHTDGSTGHHLAGSSVHVDLAFLRRGMPRLAAHMPYRVVVRKLRLCDTVPKCVSGSETEPYKCWVMSCA